MNKPNLFLVGFQKCGSSSLFDYLIQHPEIQGTSKKETFALTDKSYEHYSSENSVMNENFSWDKYLDFGSNQKYYLEGSVCNFYQKTALEYISNIPEAKVIFLIRNPLDRFSSAFNYYGRNGVYLKPGTSIQEFFEIAQNGNSDKEGVKFALDHGQYSKFIQEWESVLGKQNVLVLGMRELTKHTEAVGKKVAQFLSVEDKFPNELNHKNKSLVVKNKRLHLILRAIANFFGVKNKKVIQKYRSISRKEAEKIELPEDLKTKLMKFYTEEFKAYGSYF